MGQNKQILQMLRKRTKKGVTAIDAIQQIGCLRLAARINDLRAMGHNIETIMIKNGSRKYAKYILHEQ